MSLFYHGTDVSDKWFLAVFGPDAKDDPADWWTRALASWRRRAAGSPGMALARADVLERIRPSAPAEMVVTERRQCQGLVWLGPLDVENGGEAWVQGQLATG